MTKKILITALVFMTILSMSSIITNAKANIRKDISGIDNKEFTEPEIQIPDDKQVNKLAKNSNVMTMEANGEIKSNVKGNAQNKTPNSDNAQYTTNYLNTVELRLQMANNITIYISKE